MKVMVIGSITGLGEAFIRQATIEKFSYQTYEDNIESHLDTVKDMVKCTDVIISFRGGSLQSLNQNIQLIELAEMYSKNLLLITSFGCGDSWCYLSEKAKSLFGIKLKYKSMSETWLMLSKVNWKIIRPVGLTDKNLNGTTKKTTNKSLANGYINRECLAKLIVKVIQSDWSKMEILYAYTDK